MNALFFGAARKRRALELAMTGRLEELGFSEVVLPVLDYFEPYESLLPAASRSELYRFVGRDGELLCLRADFTPLLARLLAPRLAGLPLPLRLYYHGDVVRFEEERVGRERELYQLGAELVGAPGEEAEETVLRCFVELLARTVPPGAGAQVVLGLAGALDRLLLAADDPDALCAAVRRRERGAVQKLGGSQSLLQVVASGLPADPSAPSDLGEVAAARLTRWLGLTAEISRDFPGVALTLDLAEFAHHHLDPAFSGPGGTGGQRPYYDGLVFHGFVGGSALPVGGGGRYDRLFHRLGAEVTAAGFSFALDRLLPFAEGGEEPR